MLRQRYLFAAQKYRCTYACTRCGQINRDYGFVRAIDPVHINAFTDNLGDEYHLSGEIATTKARQKFYKLQSRVNGHCWYHGIHVNGQCRKCGTRQIWSPVFRHSTVLLLTCLAAALYIWFHGLPDGSHAALCLCSVAAAAALLTEAFALWAVHLWAKRQDKDHLPWLDAIHKRPE